MPESVFSRLRIQSRHRDRVPHRPNFRVKMLLGAAAYVLLNIFTAQGQNLAGSALGALSPSKTEAKKNNEKSNMVQLSDGILMSRDASMLSITFSDGRQEVADLSAKKLPDGKTTFRAALGYPTGFTVKIVENKELGTKAAMFISDVKGVYTVLLNSNSKSDFQDVLSPTTSKCLSICLQQGEWILTVSETGEFALISTKRPVSEAGVLENLSAKKIKLSNPSITVIRDKTGMLYFKVAQGEEKDYVEIPLSKSITQKF